MVDWVRVRKALSLAAPVSLLGAGAVYVLWFIQPLIVFSGSASGEIWAFFSHVRVFGEDVRLSMEYAIRVYSIPVMVMSAISIIAGIKGLRAFLSERVLNGWPLWGCVLASQISVVGSGYGMGVVTVINTFASYMTRSVSADTSAGRVTFPPIVVKPGWVATPMVPLLSYVFTIVSVMSLLVLVWSLERDGLLSWGDYGESGDA